MTPEPAQDDQHLALLLILVRSTPVENWP